MPAFDGGDDFVGIGGPDERFGSHSDISGNMVALIAGPDRISTAAPNEVRRRPREFLRAEFRGCRVADE